MESVKYEVGLLFITKSKTQDLGREDIIPVLWS